MVKIAFYGKGGIGKSTTVTNISVALAQRGLKVLQVGCDPKADSTRLLCAAGESSRQAASEGTAQPGKDSRSAASEGTALPGKDSRSDVLEMMNSIRMGSSGTVMDHIRARTPFGLEDVVRTGYAGVLCAEAGGPLPGQGCAGRAVITALEKLEQMGIYEICQPDVVLYDVLGDVVCGGFAMPMRKGCADYVFILTSGENMALYAAANIGLALEGFRDRGYAKLGGIILNRRNVPEEEEKVSGLAQGLRTQIAGTLSRSELVLQAEGRGQCLLQAFPDSEMAREYRALAECIAALV